jgi:DNA repair protein RecO (recombination protein O)
MRAPRVYRTEAIVLRHRRIGEADTILTLYTPEHGKFDAIAKGVRRPTSRKSGHLEELSRSSLLLARGHSLDVITQCQLIESFTSLRSDLPRLSRALYVAELVDRFSADRQENEAVYSLLSATLGQLAEAQEPDQTVRYFELQLLALTGFQPQLRSCASCRGPVDAVINSFSPAAGGVICTNCRAFETSLRPLTVNALKVLRLLQDGSGGEARRLRLTPVLAMEIEEHLNRYIQHILEREVRSRAFMRSVREPLPVSNNPALAAGERVLS